MAVMIGRAIGIGSIAATDVVKGTRGTAASPVTVSATATAIVRRVPKRRCANAFLIANLERVAKISPAT
jgi:hypothetical protein